MQDALSNVGGDGAHGSAIPLAGAAARGARTDDANCTHPPVNQSLPSKESVSSKDLLPRSNVVSVTAAVSQESKPASVMKAKVVPKSASKGGTGSAGAKSAAHDAMKSSGSIKDSMPSPTSPDFAQQDMLKVEAARMVSSGLAAKGKLPTDSIPESEQIRAQQLQQQQHIQQQQQNLHLQHIEYQRQQQHQAHQAHLAQHHHQHQLQQLQLHAQQEHLQQQQQVEILKSQLTLRFTIEKDYRASFGEFFALVHPCITRCLKCILRRFKASEGISRRLDCVKIDTHRQPVATLPDAVAD